MSRSPPSVLVQIPLSLSTHHLAQLDREKRSGVIRALAALLLAAARREAVDAAREVSDEDR